MKTCFTIGAKHAYARYFKKYGYPQKLKGSSVWPTYEAARQFADEAFKSSRILYEVFGVNADYEADTVVNPLNPQVRALSKNADIFLVPCPSSQ